MRFQLISVLRNHGVLRDNSRKQLQEAAFKSHQSEPSCTSQLQRLEQMFAVATIFPWICSECIFVQKENVQSFIFPSSQQFFILTCYWANLTGIDWRSFHFSKTPWPDAGCFARSPASKHLNLNNKKIKLNKQSVKTTMTSKEQKPNPCQLNYYNMFQAVSGVEAVKFFIQRKPYLVSTWPLLGHFWIMHHSAQSVEILSEERRTNNRE